MLGFELIKSILNIRWELFEERMMYECEEAVEAVLKENRDLIWEEEWNKEGTNGSINEVAERVPNECITKVRDSWDAFESVEVFLDKFGLFKKSRFGDNQSTRSSRGGTHHKNGSAEMCGIREILNHSAKKNFFCWDAELWSRKIPTEK